MSAPKLLFVVTEDWYFVSHRLHLAVAARDAGFDVAVATRINAHVAPIRDAGLRLLPVELNRGTTSPAVGLLELARLRRLYKSEQPDIIHHVALKPVVLGSLAARGLPVKGIVNAVAGLGTTFASRSLIARAKRLPIQYAIRAALRGNNTRVIVQNRDDAEELTALGLADAAHIRLIRGAGVDMAVFDVAPPPDGPPLVVLPARLLHLKGISEFVAAARILKSRGVAARFALVGAPDPQNATSVTTSEIEAWRRDGDVEIWGHRSDMPRVLEAATVVCLPTYYREGLPKSLIEAAAARRAIVATDVPGVRDLVQGGRAGWLVPPRNADALANALADALAHPEKRAAFADAAYADAQASFDARRIAAQTLDVYRELLS
ncbi:glycosyltransferase family 1 protein [Hyphomicrobium methylovorum]|uniref:glycosyltransferase family 4 protein n=1 Tax=Hyphomicrobium methylovorum TaxID=84 RepID=UPI0015E7BFC0|nr:glycosyltransferase family 4 protein [Hyphomicrobium methylovorum]MBA2125973.1 glycosyltransferase family 1 protein [Hyphomicrobium methylovorum]